jgi:hypothetical protein
LLKIFGKSRMKKDKPKQKPSDPTGQTRELDFERAKLVKELEKIIQTTESRCQGFKKILSAGKKTI